MSLYVIDKNVWQIDVIRGYDSNNKRIRYFERFKGGKKEAEARENEIKAEMKKGIFTPRTDLTFGDFLDKWIDEYAKSNLQPMTIYGYTKIIEEIKKELGYYKLTDLNPMLLVQYYNKLKNKSKYDKDCKYHKNRDESEKISSNTVLHYYTLINVALNYAVKWDLIYINPNSRVDRPKIMKKVAKCYDEEHTKQLLRCLENESPKYRALILLALDTGARRGEITGLDWEDIDLTGDNPYIVINKTTQYVNKKIIEKLPKNQTSIRKIYITLITTKALIEYKQSQDKLKSLYGSKWVNSNKIFTTDDGSLIHPDTPRKILGKIINKYNLPSMNFHGLRHTSISLLIASGIQTQVISKRAGHSNIGTTHSIYSHIFESTASNVANTMNQILSN